jgi:hypothetical protein
VNGNIGLVEENQGHMTKVAGHRSKVIGSKVIGSKVIRATGSEVIGDKGSRVTAQMSEVMVRRDKKLGSRS